MNAPMSDPAQATARAANSVMPNSPRSTASSDRVDEEHRVITRPDRRRAEVPQRAAGVGPDDRPGDPDEDEATDQPLGGRRTEHRDRGDDRGIRDLERDPVVERQVHEVRPLEQTDRTERADQDGDPGVPARTATAR